MAIDRIEKGHGVSSHVQEHAYGLAQRESIGVPIDTERRRNMPAATCLLQHASYPSTSLGVAIPVLRA